jgi:hypothetical protein
MQRCFMWRHNTYHSDIQHNDIQYNDTRRNDFQHTYSIMALSLMTFSITIRNCDAYHNITQHNFFNSYAECYYADCSL